jgi:hypothetical protein
MQVKMNSHKGMKSSETTHGKIIFANHDLWMVNFQCAILSVVSHFCTQVYWVSTIPFVIIKVTINNKSSIIIIWNKWHDIFKRRGKENW